MAKTEPFEKEALKYDQWFDEHRAAYESELEAIRRLLPEGSGIEVGVGSARFAAPLGIKLGVEPSPEMRRLAFARGVEAVDGVAERLPFMPNWFGFVLMVNVLCFTDDPEAALGEARRVLRKGGHLVLAFIDKASPLGKTYEEKKARSAFYKQARFFSADEVKAYLERAGFVEVTFVQTIFNDPDSINAPEPVKEGHGEGGFVVVRARKEAAQL